MILSSSAALHDEMSAAYLAARHDVFDQPGWTPTATLTGSQTTCLDRLARAEAAVRTARMVRRRVGITPCRVRSFTTSIGPV